MATLQDMTDAGIDWSILYKPAPTLEGDIVTRWTAEMSFLVPYGDQTTKFVLLAGGTPVTVGNITRLIPLQHPDYYALICTHIKVEAFGESFKGGTGPQWSHNRIRCTFTSVPWAPSDDSPATTLNVKKSGEYITIPGSSFQFPSDNTPIKQDAGVFVATTVYSVTMYLSPALGSDMSDSLMNCVNSSDMFIDGANRAPGTVRYDGMDSTFQTLANGQMSYTKTYTLTHRAVPHNLILRPDGNFEAPVNPATGGFIYAEADLTQLFS